MSPLIRKEIVRDKAYAVRDIDSPGRVALAVAWEAIDGWRVGIPNGTTVATQLTQRRALNLMHRTANQLLDRAAVRALLAGGNQ
jgi:hypothetical protein